MKAYFNKLIEAGLKAEAILSLFFEEDGMYVDDDVFSIALIGAERFRVKEDVISFELLGNDDNLEKISLVLARDGFFESLPDHLLITAVEKKTKGSTKSKLIAKQIRQWRDLFSAYEKALFDVSLYLQKNQEIFSYYQDILLDFWHLSTLKEILSGKQIDLLLQLLPIAGKVASNRKLAEQCFELILGVKVRILDAAPIVNQLPSGNLVRMGEGVLGRNFILGYKFFDGIPSLRIEVNPSIQNVKDFLPGGDSYKILEEVLINYFIPADMDSKVEIIVKNQDEMRFKLPTRENANLQNTENSILGITSRI